MHSKQWLLAVLLSVSFGFASPYAHAADTTPPTVSITKPISGGFASTTAFSVNATSSDNVAVAGVQFVLDGVNLGAQDTTSPYSVAWNTTTASNGPHTLVARARDTSGNTATSTVVTVTVDNQAPAGTIAINNGTAATNSTAVTLTLSASDTQGAVTQMRFSNTGTSFNAAVAYATTSAWTLTTGAGTKTVYAQFKDAAGNWSASVTSSIVLDTTAPTISAVAASGIATSTAAITWTTNETATSQVNYGLTTGYGATTTLDAALVTTHSIVLSGLTPATTYNYRVRSKDAAGNEKVGSNATFTTASTPPPPFSLTLSNSGDSTVTQGSTVSNAIGVTITGGGSATPTFIQEAHAQNGPSVTSLTVTPSANVSAGDELILHVNVRNGPATTVTDSQGDVWTKQISDHYASDAYLEVWTAPVNTGGTKPVVTVSEASGGFITLDLLEYSGVNTASPIDVSAQNQGVASGSLSAGATAAISGPNELGIVVAAGDGAGTFTASSGFTQRSNQAPVPMTGIPLATAEKSLSSGTFTGTYSVDFAAYGVVGYVVKSGSSAVSLSIAGLPTGATASFVPSSCLVTCTSIATITAANSAAAGMYPIAVTGTTGAVAAQTNFNLIVNALTPDTTAPSVPTNLTAANIAASSLTISWSASTDNVGVAGYTVFRGGAQVATTTATTFADSGLMAGTSYNYTVAAFDAAGNASAQSTPLQVSTLSDTTAPTVTVTAPTAGSTVSGHAVSISATATDNVGVAGVQFQIDGTNVGSLVTTSPYALVWDSTTVTDGAHTITAVGGDAAGNLGTSTPVSITVNNTTPPPGTWVNVSPAGVSTDPNNPADNFGFQSMAIDPQNPSTVYVGTAYQGLYKTTDSGASWFRVDTTPDLFTGGRLWCLAIDNFNPNTLYACDGYGGAQGVFKSTDGGITWTEMMSPSLYSQTSADIYSIATDPYMANHILVAFHSGWNFGSDSGVIESFDGGATWIVHNPAGPWGAGNYISFLNNSSTWLLSTQGDGFWKTTDGGTTWTQVVSAYNMQHGAEELYHSSVNNAWYMGAVGALLRSADNGSTWSPVAVTSPDGYNAVIGDGVNLYTQSANTGLNSTGPNSYITSPEADGVNWTMQNSQKFSDGPMSMVYDPINHYIYSSNWDSGVWRLQTSSSNVPAPTAALMVSPNSIGSGSLSTLTWSSTNASSVTIDNGIGMVPASGSMSVSPATTTTYTLTAINSNAVATASTTVTVVPAPPDTIPPTVSLSVPANNATLSGTIPVTATASDNVGIVGVQFKLDGANLGAEQTTAPYYSISWNTATSLNGVHILTAVARDAAGNTTTASTVTVVVSNNSSLSLINGGAASVSAGASTANSVSVTSQTSGGGSATFIQEAHAQNGPSVTSLTVTPSANVSAGDELILHVNVRNGPATTVTDSQGDVWTKQISDHYASDAYLEVWTAPVNTGGTKPVVTVSEASGGFITLDLLEYSGVNTASPIDVSAQNQGVASGSLSAGATAAISGPNELGIVVAAGDGAGTFTASSGFTQRSNQAPVPMTGIPLATAEKSLSSGTFTGTYSVDFAAYGVVGYVVKGSGATSSPTVTFQALGLPANAAATFSPASCSAACGTVITITTSSTTPAGTYPVVVVGSTSADADTTEFDLTVN